MVLMFHFQHDTNHSLSDWNERPNIQRLPECELLLICQREIANALFRLR